jgi:hypothetical protein
MIISRAFQMLAVIAFGFATCAGVSAQAAITKEAQLI